MEKRFGIDPAQTYMSGGKVVSGASLIDNRVINNAVIAQLERQYRAANEKRRDDKAMEGT